MERRDSDGIVLFGATGDLCYRKIFPALYHLVRRGLLTVPIIGVARQGSDVAWLVKRVRDSLKAFVPDADEAVIQKLAALMRYVDGDYNKRSTFEALRKALGSAQRPLHYLAIPPSMFAIVIEHLTATENAQGARVVIEKPFGHDLASARALNQTLHKHFPESSIFRIDHYLGKEAVQNLLALRFGNSLFEPLWVRGRISHVQITVSEELGVEGRGAFYDQTGAMRDMIQNHMLQLLCIMAMEPPVSNDPNAIRDEKLKVLHALRPLEGNDVAANVVRGQYRAGASKGAPAVGYLEEKGIPPDSTTETFVALKAQIDTWRWAGVPFYLRTGKRLQEQVAEIVVYFEDVPHELFERASNAGPNRMVISLQPHDSITLTILAKNPGETMRLRPVDLRLDMDESFKTPQLDAYERLLTDVIKGNLTLFMRRDELDAAWRWVDPIREAWARSDEAPKGYTAGSWGPAASSSLIARDGYAWHGEL